MKIRTVGDLAVWMAHRNAVLSFKPCSPNRPPGIIVNLVADCPPGEGRRHEATLTVNEWDALEFRPKDFQNGSPVRDLLAETVVMAAEQLELVDHLHK